MPFLAKSEGLALPMMIQSCLGVPAAMVTREAESLSLLGLFHGEKDKLNVCFHGWLATPNAKQISYGLGADAAHTRRIRKKRNHANES